MDNLHPHGPERFKPSRFDVPPHDGQDAHLREEIFQKLKADSGIQVSGLELTVTDGAVGIYGKISSAQMGEQIVNVIHKVSGVASVEDHLILERVPLEGPVKGIL